MNSSIFFAILVCSYERWKQKFVWSLIWNIRVSPTYLEPNLKHPHIAKGTKTYKDAPRKKWEPADVVQGTWQYKNGCQYFQWAAISFVLFGTADELNIMRSCTDKIREEFSNSISVGRKVSGLFIGNWQKVYQVNTLSNVLDAFLQR